MRTTKQIKSLFELQPLVVSMRTLENETHTQTHTIVLESEMKETMA